MNEIKVSTIDELKAELEVIELEERLEMSSMTAMLVDQPIDIGNGICCCS